MTGNIVPFPPRGRSDAVSHRGQEQDVRPLSARALNHAMLLELLGAEPIFINRIYVEIVGGVLPALWLSHAMQQARTDPAAGDREPRFAMSARECTDETGITRAQQLRCRRRLVQLGLLSEEWTSHGIRCYRLHLDELRRMLRERVRPLAAAVERMRQSA